MYIQLTLNIRNASHKNVFNSRIYFHILFAFIACHVKFLTTLQC